ncbi:MAG TPA: hypothetical protein VGM02_01545 [Acidobacteriaceae bacterium]|jgi:hypothetical protein
MSFGKVVPVKGLVGSFPGHVSRLGPLNITARQVLPTTPNPIQFGQAVVINPATNTYQSVADFINGGGTMTSALFAGIAVEEVKTTGSYPYSANGTTGAYLPGDQAEVLNFGTISVAVNVGTPQSQGAVYVRTSANGANTIIGGIEATADAGHQVTLTGVVFSSGVLDSNNGAEITLLNRVAA